VQVEVVAGRDVHHSTITTPLNFAASAGRLTIIRVLYGCPLTPTIRSPSTGVL
jgi:hypothetical protein